MELLPFLLIVLAGGFLFLSYRRQSQQGKAIQQVQSGLAPGQDGKILEVGPEIVVLETGPGQTVRWNRAAIRNVVTKEAEPAPVGEEEGPPSTNSPVGD
jgi:preprotein translocase YajC subunit